MNTDILDNITVSYKHTGLSGYSEQFVDMLSDGSWAIRRSQFAKAIKPPKFMLELLQLPATNPTTFESLGIKTIDNLIAVEMQNILVQRSNDVLLVPFYPADPTNNLAIFANARLVKLLSGMFPGALWYGSTNHGPLVLVGEEIIGVLMPCAVSHGGDLPVLRHPTT